MTSQVGLPTYETLLAEAIKSLAVDSGTVTAPEVIGSSTLRDTAKAWATNVHRNRLVKIIRGQGVGQLRVIQANLPGSLTINQAWSRSVGVGDAYVILGIDLSTVFGTGSGSTYVNSNIAAADAARRFETTTRKLAWAVIVVETNGQLFGTAAAQTLPLAAGGSMGVGKIDLSTFYFRNQVAGQNGTVHILGVEE